jgi:aspartyl-tRNA(Asn)/glutamyl-tRNA(Gln) amidotransferase subunit B
LARRLRDSAVKAVSDEGQLTAWVEEVLRENPAVVEQFRRGKKEVLQFLIGQVMKKSEGKAAPPVVKKILEKELEK